MFKADSVRMNTWQRMHSVIPGEHKLTGRRLLKFLRRFLACGKREGAISWRFRRLSRGSDSTQFVPLHFKGTDAVIQLQYVSRSTAADKQRESHTDATATGLKTHPHRTLCGKRTRVVCAENKCARKCHQTPQVVVRCVSAAPVYFSVPFHFSGQSLQRFMGKRKEESPGSTLLPTPSS